ncbi:hypothetical protein [Natrinema salaciae]|uniref:Regulator of chromosome condensation (RCC1) repeat-containing protein n=1 Tax=Natrinema salaciae TaxID=1186196 RepID=A0A1H9GHI4_9EURY|nr:hypothetical protein [Natrinema salaciae]SEQ49483.1 hypothetical protein SAMN04489841_1885 [Natrinema salaciae]
MWDFDAETNDDLTWTTCSTPIDGAVYDVTNTANGPCAVGEGGTVVGRAPDGSWGTVVDDGPAARGESLHAVATTDDATRIWFAGSGGAVGHYDLPTGNRVDHSGPDGMDGTVRALTVAGDRGSEKLLLADGNGVVLPGTVAGAEPNWDRRTNPADGTAITALAADGDGRGYGVDDDGTVWETTETGWERIGLAGVEDSLYAAAAGESTLVVGGGNGRLYERDETDGWTPYSVGDAAIECLDVAEGTRIAGGESGLLRIREGGSWRETDWNGTRTIHGVLVGSPSVAVGENGLVLERTAE